jgi:hypothetical protein
METDATQVWMVRSAGKNGVPVTLYATHYRHRAGLAFSTRAKMVEFIERLKPACVTILPESFEPLNDSQLFDELVTLPGLTHFALDPPADGGRLRLCPIARVLNALRWS